MPPDPVNIAAKSHMIAIETSSDVCSVAAFSDGILIQEIRTDIARSHATQLVPMMERLLTESLDTHIDVIAVSSGPGSFTGLRIGVSAAKGLAFARRARIVSVPTLTGIAHGVMKQSFTVQSSRTRSPAEQAIIVVSPSRKEEVYCAAFRGYSGEYPRCVLTEAAVDIHSFEDLFARNGIRNAQVILSAPIPVFESLMEKIPSYTVRVKKPSAVDVGYWALQKVFRGEYEDTSTYEPYYLKAFHAEKPRLSALDRLSF